MLDSPSTRDEFNAVRDLSFVSTMHDGLVLHDVMRDTISYGLAESDPARHGQYRSGWQYEATRRAVREDRLAVHRRPALPRAEPEHPQCLLRPGAMDVSVAPALRSDREGIEEIARPSRRNPQLDPAMARSPSGNVLRRANRNRAPQASPSSSSTTRSIPRCCTRTHHRCVVRHLRRNRCCLTSASSSADVGSLASRGGLSPAQAACMAEIKRLYMEMRPNLRRATRP
jgi:hypothetical protein